VIDAGELNIFADSNVLVFNIVGAVQVAGVRGVGISIAINNIKRDVEAFLGTDTDEIDDNAADVYTLSGGVDIDAIARGFTGAFAVSGVKVSGEDSSKHITKSQRQAKEADLSASGLFDLGALRQQQDQSGGGGTAFGVSGATAVNFGSDKARAYVNDNVIIVTGSTEDTFIDALNSAQLAAATGAAAYMSANKSSKARGFVGAISVNDVDSNAEAFVDELTLTTRNLKLNASFPEQAAQTAVAAGGVINRNKDGVNIAGSFAINDLVHTTKAQIDNSTINASADIELSAQDKSHLGVGAGTATFGGSSGWGASVGVNQALSTTKASIDNSRVVHGGNLILDADTDNDIVTVTVSLGVNPVAVAGTISVNIIGNTTAATITNSKNYLGSDFDNPDTLSTGNVDVDAKDDSDITAVAGALGVGAGGGGGGDSTFGLGAAFAVNLIGKGQRDQIVKAEIDNSEFIAKDLDVEATSNSTINSYSVGAGGAKKVGIAGSVSVNQIKSDIDAGVNNSRVFLDDGDVFIKSRDNSDINVLAGGIALSQIASVGAAVAVNIIDNTNDASIDNITLETSPINSSSFNGNVDLIADTDATIDSYAIAGAGAASWSADDLSAEDQAGDSFTLAIAGAGAYNKVTNETSAEITNGSVIDAEQGYVKADASDTSTIDADGGGVALALNLGSEAASTNLSFGVSVAINEMKNKVIAGIDASSVEAEGNIDVLANSDPTIKALTIGGAVSGSNSQSGFNGAFAGAGSGNTIKDGSETKAYISDTNTVTNAGANDSDTGITLGAVISKNGNISVEAQDTPKVVADSGGVALSGSYAQAGSASNVSIGISASKNEIDVDVIALVDNSTLIADDYDIVARSFNDSDNDNAFDRDLTDTRGLNGAIDDVFKNEEDHAEIHALSIGGALAATIDSGGPATG